MSDDAPAAQLRSGEAWNEFCDALKSAGRIVLERSPDSDLDRAEGYRYLTRLLRMGLKLSLEYADPAAPELIRYMDETQKFGVDNPDQLYQWARISANYEYRLSGPRGSVGYIGIGVYAGSAGRGGRRTVAHVHADELEIGPDDCIELILSARAPRELDPARARHDHAPHPPDHERPCDRGSRCPSARTSRSLGTTPATRTLARGQGTRARGQTGDRFSHCLRGPVGPLGPATKHASSLRCPHG
ncbi:MAG: hypothetical protein O7B23_01295 [Deltaproteobacteria bacterium]|nr:hypothetical protein [Deltaproteobacteria bacterium]